VLVFNSALLFFSVITHFTHSNNSSITTLSHLSHHCIIFLKHLALVCLHSLYYKLVHHLLYVPHNHLLFVHYAYNLLVAHSTICSQHLSICSSFPWAPRNSLKLIIDFESANDHVTITYLSTGSPVTNTTPN